ncbi:MAG: thioredoxin TrxC [Proteobacteria bacterium]|nr:thioredoxin TrxC [Pseudomonadota bacterium]
MTGSDSVIVRCPSCGTKNRIPASRLNQGPKCGKCQAALNAETLEGPAGPVVVTDANFEPEVLRSPLPVLLDCWAEWCGPCRMVGPIVEELAREWQGRIKVGKLNVDQNPGTAGRFQIRSIPTLLVFDRGQVADTIVGALPKAQIVQRMSPWL